jgi:hypothetical protein
MKITKPEVAAYNHGYCYAITYSARKAISHVELTQASEHFYDKAKLQSMFCAGYQVAIGHIGEGKISVSTLLTNADLT